jgi:hypothetical protein
VTHALLAHGSGFLLLVTAVFALIQVTKAKIVLTRLERVALSLAVVSGLFDLGSLLFVLTVNSNAMLGRRDPGFFGLLMTCVAVAPIPLVFFAFAKRARDKSQRNGVM